jgi:hypothetical protein
MDLYNVKPCYDNGAASFLLPEPNKSQSWSWSRFQMYQFLFSLYRPKDRGRSWSQNWSRIIFSFQNHANMLQLRFWLRLQPLFLSLYSEKIQNWFQFLTFSLYSSIGQWTGVGARTWAASFFHPKTTPTWCGSVSSSGSDPYSLTYIVKNP